MVCVITFFMSVNLNMVVFCELSTSQHIISFKLSIIRKSCYTCVQIYTSKQRTIIDEVEEEEERGL